MQPEVRAQRDRQMYSSVLPNARVTDAAKCTCKYQACPGSEAISAEQATGSAFPRPPSKKSDDFSMLHSNCLWDGDGCDGTALPWDLICGYRDGRWSLSQCGMALSIDQRSVPRGWEMPVSNEPQTRTCSSMLFSVQVVAFVGLKHESCRLRNHPHRQLNNAGLVRVCVA